MLHRLSRCFSVDTINLVLFETNIKRVEMNNVKYRPAEEPAKLYILNEYLAYPEIPCAHSDFRSTPFFAGVVGNLRTRQWTYRAQLLL